jgi:hypothetical protein
MFYSQSLYNLDFVQCFNKVLLYDYVNRNNLISSLSGIMLYYDSLTSVNDIIVFGEY